MSKNKDYQLVVYDGRGSVSGKFVYGTPISNLPMGPEIKKALEEVGGLDKKGNYNTRNRYNLNKFLIELENYKGDLSVREKLWLCEVKQREDKDAYIKIEIVKN